MPTTPTPEEPAAPSLSEVLEAAVSGVGGSHRPGQLEMAQAVEHSFLSGEHLLVQAGTGTGKSLAYLVPALLHHERVVVATATIALQSQLVERDLPTLVDAIEPLIGRRPNFAVLKGRNNYVCLHRLNGGMADDADQESLFDPSATSALGRESKRVREWAESTETGDRFELNPDVDGRVWRAFSVSGRECLGQKCPQFEDCFAEKAREKAREAEVVVTNHALLAIGALENVPVLPEHDAVIVDEAHELVDRATGSATRELNAPMIERAARRTRRIVDEDAEELLEDAAAALQAAVDELEPARIERSQGTLFSALTLVRDAAHAVIAAMTADKNTSIDAGIKQATRADLDEIFDTAGRLLELDQWDVAWIADDERRGRSIKLAPLSVAGLLRESLFAQSTVVLTSATLELGGSFDSVAASVGLGGEKAPSWRGMDVGSPFAYDKQGILYVASGLPRPGRDGLAQETIDELVSLIEAAGGRTLGLFSSRRAAQQAADAVRARGVTLLAQGDDSIPNLVRKFAEQPRSCLFGTLSLWQGVDVPGHSCTLVVIDRLPFPRPDDPLVAARQKAVDDAGRSGFMAVSVPRAALMLAQGVGRLIRSTDDRGVVAVLDSRLATARYGGYVRSSLPPFWYTTDGDRVRTSLRALDDKVTIAEAEGALKDNAAPKKAANKKAASTKE